MGRAENIKTDFSRGHHREMLTWQRRQMWTEEAIEQYGRWMGLIPGMTAVDIGCGLGYLGYTYWKYFGKGGHYVGVDIKASLLEKASEKAKSWAVDGKASFVVADVYQLPFEDDSVDWVMCQALMIHLERPESALAEMIRILKPGGLILCKEPDNLRPTLVRAYCSLPDYSIETELLYHKVSLIANAGRIKLGRGDRGIGPKIPHMLCEMGIEEFDVRTKDTVPFVEPPYRTERQQETIKNMKKYLLSKESFKVRVDEQREDFLSGGGDPDDFDKLLEIGEKQRLIQLQQIENKEFFICGAYPVYVIKGKKNV